MRILFLLLLTGCVTRLPYDGDFCYIYEEMFVCSEKQHDGHFADVVYEKLPEKYKKNGYIINTVESFEQCHSQP